VAEAEGHLEVHRAGLIQEEVQAVHIHQIVGKADLHRGTDGTTKGEKDREVPIARKEVTGQITEGMANRLHRF